MNDIHAIENTRRLAADALDRASQTVREMRTGVSDRAAAAQRYVSDYASAGTRYVAEHPMKSALIAAAIGAAVAGLVIALRHREDRDTWF